MKKALALVMAIAMVASMAAVSFAATQINPGVTGTDPVVEYDTQLYTYTKAGGFVNVTNGKVAFGKTVYVNLKDANGDIIKDADAVKGLKVDAKWEKNGNYVKSVEIVKEGASDSDGARYMIAIATTGSSLEEVTVLGEVAVKGKSYYEVVEAGKLVGKKADVKFDFDVELLLGWAEANATDGMDVTTKTVYDFEVVPAADEEDFALSFGPLSVETDVKNMKKVIMAYNDKDSEELLDAYVDADLVFVNCEATFRRTAEVTVDLADDEYFYEVVDGVLVEVEGEYDEWTEEFTFKTRKLGNYVISDTELVVEEVVATNPSTGAAA